MALEYNLNTHLKYHLKRLAGAVTGVESAALFEWKVTIKGAVQSAKKCKY